MPRLIQAGMGVRISSYALANASARLGAVGVISSVGLRHIVIEEVRKGDPQTLEIARSFPIKRYVDELLAFAPGRDKNKRPAPMDHPDPVKSELPRRLSVICTYIEVVRAKLGHRGKVGVNVMWKCAVSVLPTIYGAMLAGADALLCGAGVPMELPDIVTRLRRGLSLEYKPLTGTNTNAAFDLGNDDAAGFLSRIAPPKLIPILSNFAFPKRIMDIWEREYNGTRPFAFVLEDHKAGGHNAPPRNKVDFTEQDDIDSYFDKAKALGVPIYIAGAGDTREDMLAWRERGAYGLQVGSRFALCSDSGMKPEVRQALIDRNARGEGQVLTSNRLSSTGYPFKYAPLPGTLSDPDVYANRKRICDKGYLVHSHFEEKADGTVEETYICPAMPEKQFENLGGDPAESADRVCLCNGLLATAGLSQTNEPPIVTLGLSALKVKRLLSAREVIEDIMTPEAVREAEAALAEPITVGAGA